MICGALPLPNNELYLTYFACAYDYMSKNKRELLKRIRVLDVAYTLANKDAIWLANMMTRSVGFGEFADKTLKISDQRKLIPYLHIDEDITFYRIAWMIYHATDKVNHVLLHWLAENCGFYPFTDFHKSAAIDYFHTGEIALKYNVQPWNRQPTKNYSIAHDIEAVMSTKNFAGNVSTSRNASAVPMEENSNDASNKADEFADSLFNCCPYRMTRSRDMTTLISRMKSATGKTKKNLPNNATDSVDSGSKTNTMTLTLESYARTYGPTVEVPIVDDISPDLRKFGPTGVTRDQYIDMVLRGKINPGNIAYGYKIDALCSDDGHRELYFNPNYIVVPGTIESLTSSFLLGNKDTRMSEKDVRSALESMIKGEHTMTAHLLPLIPIKNTNNEPTFDALVKLESMRVSLWNDQRCKKMTLPIVIGHNDGICILVEAILESPLFVVETILTQLCNESTVARDVVIPVPDPIVTHTLATFIAVNVPHRVLETMNPLTTANKETLLLPNEITDAIQSEEYGMESVWKWDKNSEERSLARYFQRNGYTDANPAAYTYKKKYQNMLNAYTSENCHYPDDIKKTIIDMDKKAKELQQKNQIQPGILRIDANTSNTRMEMSDLFGSS